MQWRWIRNYLPPAPALKLKSCTQHQAHQGGHREASCCMDGSDEAILARYLNVTHVMIVDTRDADDLSCSQDRSRRPAYGASMSAANINFLDERSPDFSLSPSKL